MARRWLILYFLGFLIIPVALPAADISSTSAQFLKIPVGVRAAAMGEAFTALSDDATAVHWNPAGLASYDGLQVTLQHVSLFEGLNYEFLGASFALPSGTAFGLSAALNHSPSFNSTNDPLAVVGSSSDLALGVGIAQKAGSVLAFGVDAKLLNSTLSGQKATGVAMGAGVRASFAGDRVALGLSLQDAGQISGYGPGSPAEKLPTTLRAGVAGRILAEGNVRPLLALEFKKAVDEDAVAEAGTETWLGPEGKCVAFRAGYQSSKPLKELGGASGLSLGVGLRLGSLQFDYALVPFGDLGNTHRFSMSYRLARATRQAEAASAAEEKPVAVAVQPQMADARMGSLQSATFDIKPEARTDIKNWTLDITDAQGKLVRRYEGKGVPPRSLTWDGRDEQGQVVTGGVFTNYQLRAVDRKGREISAGQSVMDIASSGLDLRGMDPRVLALRPSNVVIPEAATEAPRPEPFPMPRLDVKMGPLGRLGLIKVPALLFAKDSPTLRREYGPYLNEVAAMIRGYRNARVYVEGHAWREAEQAPAAGRGADLVRLSQERADAVLRYLVEEGKVTPESLYARGHGDSAPADLTPGEKAEAGNRRVDILIQTLEPGAENTHGAQP